MFEKLNQKNVIVILSVSTAALFLIAAILAFIPVLRGENPFSGYGKSVNDQKNLSLAGITEISVSASSEDVNIIPSDSDGLKVHFHGKYSSNSKDQAPRLEVDTSGSRIDIDIKRIPVSGFAVYSNLSLDLYLPVTYAKSLKISTSSGDTSAEGVKLSSFFCEGSSGDFSGKDMSAKEMVLKRSSGEVRIDAVDSDSFRCSTSSGDISIEKLSSKAAEVSSTSGEVELDEINAGSFSHESSSGDLSVHSLFTNDTEVKTSSGEVTIGSFTGNITGEATSGDVSIKFKEFNNNIRYKTSSGSVRIKLPENSEFYLKANCSSGDISNAFPVTVKEAFDEHSLEGVCKSDRNRIELRTSSGDVKIYK